MNIIGRIDKADFPELDLQNISLKVDTGAYTSSIHTHDIRVIEQDGVKYIEFEILDPSHPKFNDRTFKVKNFEEKKIKSSFGTVEQRYIVNTIIIIFGQEFPIKLSLSERSDMKYPILLGRRFLNKDFMVNTALKNVSYKVKKDKKLNKLNKAK